nr:immunoglobulin light chain junction region [Macaca mulatta]MOY04858.1 immunoglobulin light chain junction region [Macaca mulatta]MOY04949.1 immunoglobulin light chain junction region [Macaca mulatta]MOY05043.1 immunoglobulin light chain junction region [Macaca mulatta]MOY05527.1 immunoglobulin light chain junction region [Macaca mulatta]
DYYCMIWHNNVLF